MAITETAKKAWPDEDLAILKEFYPTEGYKGVLKRLGGRKTKVSISSKAMRLGIRSHAPRESHGMVGTRTYRAWYSAKDRATNPNHPEHHRYKAAGICDRWASSFEAFLEDMGEAPTDGHWIDRIDPERGYEPDNCRWVTPKQSAANTRKRSSKIPFKGINQLPSGRWRACAFISGRKRDLGVFDTPEEAARAFDSAVLDAHGEYAMTNERAGLFGD